MSTDRDVDRIVRSWLEEGVTALPDRVLDNVLDQLPATHQRRSWWPARRLHEMNTPLRIAMAAAAVLVVALLGITILPKLEGVAAPIATPSPSPTQIPRDLHLGPLTAGAYRATPFVPPDGWSACMVPPASGCSDPPRASSIRVRFTVPDGWAGAPFESVWLSDTNNSGPAGAGVLFERGGALHDDPCRHDNRNPNIPVGPTVDDFATALANHPLLDATTPVDVNLGGYVGKYVELHLPSDISTCAESYYPWEPGLYAQGPSQHRRLWILDVNGVRVVVHASDYPGTSPQRLAELDAIVESIQIEP